MKILYFYFVVLLTGLTLSCEKNETSEKWHLIEYYGTIAGISKTFPKGACTWTLGEKELVIDLNVPDPILRSTKSFYAITTTSQGEQWSVDSLGIFTATRSKDTLYLKAPCCDMIDYTLIED